MSALRTAVAAGWRMDWQYVFDYNPLFESLHDEPEFQEMRTEIAAEMAEQLKNVRRVEPDTHSVDQGDEARIITQAVEKEVTEN